MILAAFKLTIGVAMGCDADSPAEFLHVPAPNGPLKFQMRLASDPRLLPVVRSTISELATAMGFEGTECRRITLAVDEALSNVIRHAYGNECNHEIELDCQAQGDCLEFTFIDHGEPADPTKICAQPLDEVALGGRGTHIIRQVMDEVSYDRLHNRNRLRLKKYMPGARRAT